MTPATPLCTPERPLSATRLAQYATVRGRCERYLRLALFPSEGEALMQQLLKLRLRCQRYTSSYITPMGQEMFYRYQQSLIDEAITTLETLTPGNSMIQLPSKTGGS